MNLGKLYRQCCLNCWENFYISEREIEEGADLNFCSDNCRRLFFETNTDK